MIAPAETEVGNRFGAIISKIQCREGREQVQLPHTPIEAGRLEVLDEIAVLVDEPARYFRQKFARRGRIYAVA